MSHSLLVYPQGINEKRFRGTRGKLDIFLRCVIRHRKSTKGVKMTATTKLAIFVLCFFATSAYGMDLLGTQPEETALSSAKDENFAESNRRKNVPSTRNQSIQNNSIGSEFRFKRDIETGKEFIYIDTPKNNDGTLSFQQMRFVQGFTEIGRTIVLTPLPELANGKTKEQGLVNSDYNPWSGEIYLDQQNKIDKLLSEGYTVIVEGTSPRSDSHERLTSKSGNVASYGENSVLIERPSNPTGSLSLAQLRFMQNMGEEGKVVIIKPLPIFDNGQTKEFKFVSNSVDPVFGYSFRYHQDSINRGLQRGCTVVVVQ